MACLFAAREEASNRRKRNQQIPALSTWVATNGKRSIIFFRFTIVSVRRFACFLPWAFYDSCMTDSAHGTPNGLIGETSPYLLLHAHNPVDWYPWGPEALEKARKEGKMIFISIGNRCANSTKVWSSKGTLISKLTAMLARSTLVRISSGK